MVPPMMSSKGGREYRVGSNARREGINWHTPEVHTGSGEGNISWPPTAEGTATARIPAANAPCTHTQTQHRVGGTVSTIHVFSNHLSRGGCEWTSLLVLYFSTAQQPCLLFSVYQQHCKPPRRAFFIKSVSLCIPEQQHTPARHWAHPPVPGSVMGPGLGPAAGQPPGTHPGAACRAQPCNINSTQTNTPLSHD